MAEFLFFATLDDHARIAEALVREFGASFVVDRGTDERLTRVKRPEALLDVIAGSAFGSRLFVLSPAWSREPLEASEIARPGESSLFHIRGRYGGPSLDYIAKHLEIAGANQYVTPSSVATFPTYYMSTGEEPRPRSMDSALALVRKLMLQGGRRTRTREAARSGPVAATGALKAYASGCWLRVGGWHHDPREA